MPQLPLAARVVEVIADRGADYTPRYKYGSGCLVVGRTVLTAAHVVTGALSVLVRGPDKIARQAALDPAFVGDSDGPGPDMALIEIIDTVVDVPPMGLAAVDRDSSAGDPVERCHVIGYPVFKERDNGGRFRETVDAFGHVPVLSGLAGGLLSVQVSSDPPEPLPPAQVALGDSPWSGMSGGPVVADGLLLAVVTEHAPREGPSAITATPLTALEHNPQHPGWGQGVADPAAWWARLGVPGVKALTRLPAPPGRRRPAYWASVREIRQRTEVLTCRQAELAGIASFAQSDEGYRWLVGEAWAGKTSLLAEAAMTLSGGIDVVCYFLSRREADADSSRFLAAVVPQLSDLLDEDPPAAGLHEFRALWQRAAERANAQGHHLLLIIDGLDEDLFPPGLPSVAAGLPATAGGFAHVLVSSRPHPKLPGDIPVGHPLNHVQPVVVEPFTGSQELAVLARQEIDDLLRREDDGLMTDVLGLLTAAAGPLAIRDLAAMSLAAPQSVALAQRIRRMLTTSAARSLQTAGQAGSDRYQFAHESLLAYAQAHDDLKDPDFRRRIHEWAEKWRIAGWPTSAGGEIRTPHYLLDTYPSTLARDPHRLAQLVSDIGWLEAAIQPAGPERVLADLRRAAAANPTDTMVPAVLMSLNGQAHNLQFTRPLDQPGYILRQLWMQSAELGQARVADEARHYLQFRSGSGPCLLPQWTTRHASRALSAELGRHDAGVTALAVLADGRLVTSGSDGRVLIWDPTDPGAAPTELGRPGWEVVALDVLADGRVITCGFDKPVLIWDPAHPGAAPAQLDHRNARPLGAATVLADGRVVTSEKSGRVVIWDPAHRDAVPTELGSHDGGVWAMASAGGRLVTSGSDGRVLIWDPDHPGTPPAELGRHDLVVHAVAALADGRVVTGGDDGWVLIWDLAHPGTPPAELGRHDLPVLAVAVLADGRVVTGGEDGRVLIWDHGTAPAELGRHDLVVRAVAVLADGRVVTGGEDGRVLIWDHGTAPAELGRRNLPVQAVAVLADGRVVTGGDDGWVLVWDPDHPGTPPAELGRHDLVVRSVAALADGRVVTAGFEEPVRVWDLAHPGAAPVELGRHDRGVMVMAVVTLTDGRVVTGGNDGQLLVWEADHPGVTPSVLGRHVPDLIARHGGWAMALAVLADGRVVTGGGDGRVLMWDPDHPGTTPAELGRHDLAVRGVAALADGRLITGGYEGRVLMWDPDHPGTEVLQLNCSVGALATASLSPTRSCLVVAHQGNGFSCWSITG